jgi:hypothetical protein
MRGVGFGRVGFKQASGCPRMRNEPEEGSRSVEGPLISVSRRRQLGDDPRQWRVSLEVNFGPPFRSKKWRRGHSQCLPSSAIYRATGWPL